MSLPYTQPKRYLPKVEVCNCCVRACGNFPPRHRDLGVGDVPGDASLNKLHDLIDAALKKKVSQRIELT